MLSFLLESQRHYGYSWHYTTQNISLTPFYSSSYSLSFWLSSRLLSLHLSLKHFPYACVSIMRCMPLFKQYVRNAFACAAVTLLSTGVCQQPNV